MSFIIKKLKYHSYFLNNVLIRRPYLTEERILNVLQHFESREIQENGRIALHGYDLEAKKFLKVIIEIENGEEYIFNAFLDRSYKGKRK